MKKRVIPLFTFFCFILNVYPDQHGKKLTIEWIHSDEAQSIAAVPRYQWLENNTAIFYDVRQPKKERTFLRFDPENPHELKPMVDLIKVRSSLKELVHDTLTNLDWPLTFDEKGEKALYIYEKDIFILDLKTSVFKQITDTDEEEKSPRFSPDGSKVAFVRENDLYIIDLDRSREKRLTRDGSETILNGTVSWCTGKRSLDGRILATGGPRIQKRLYSCERMNLR